MIEKVIPNNLNEFKLDSYTVNYFKTKIETNSLLNMYLFYGEQGTGKRTFVYLINKEINDQEKEFNLVEVDKNTSIEYLQTIINGCLANKLRVIFVSDEKFIDIPNILKEVACTFYFQHTDVMYRREVCAKALGEEVIGYNYSDLVCYLSDLFTDNLRTPLALIEMYQDDLDTLKKALIELNKFKCDRVNNSSGIVLEFLDLIPDKYGDKEEIEDLYQVNRFLSDFEVKDAYGIFFNEKRLHVVNNFDEYLDEFIDKSLSKFLSNDYEIERYKLLKFLQSYINELKRDNIWSTDYFYNNVENILKEAARRYECSRN